MSESNNYSSVSALDQAVASFFSGRSPLDEATNQQWSDILVRLSASMAEGNSCLVLTKSEKKVINDSMEQGLTLVSDVTHQQNEPSDKIIQRPLVLSDQRLYWYRYWRYECDLAKKIQHFTTFVFKSPEGLEALLDTYFPAQDDDSETDWQREAAKLVVKQRFTMITGGPGTGKTTTVLRILAVLQELHRQNDELSVPLNIALVAPTGKAAMRLQESLLNGIRSLPAEDAIKQAIPREVMTIHKLLGAIRFSPYFKHDQDNPLVYDLIVVDEASMVDLALVAKLISAMKDDARLILLGDQDQLASVESGYVLSDLARALPEHTLNLQKTWRFNTSIKALATAINNQQAQQAWDLLNQESEYLACVKDNLIATILQGYEAYQQAVKAYVAGKHSDAGLVYKAFAEFQVLCVNRQGALGVEGINQAIELTQHRRAALRGGSAWYDGRPVMVTRNDALLGLFNGDVGICLPNPEKSDSPYSVHFKVEEGWKKVYPSRLTACETVYAMTIHKSQGSEFSEVLVVLPDKPSPLMTRELIYTAVTRAKKKVHVFAKREVFIQGVSRSVERASGLVEVLKSMSGKHKL